VAFDTLHRAEPAQRTAHQVVSVENQTPGSMRCEPKRDCGGLGGGTKWYSESAYTYTFSSSDIAPDVGNKPNRIENYADELYR
jgi:hypothetical protein